MPIDPQTPSSTTFVARWKKSFESSESGGHLPAAYLLVGPPNSGKLAAALEIAAVLLGPHPNHPDLLHIAPEKGTIKIEAIRNLIHRVSLKPFQADRIVVILEDAHEMTEGAANALLKTLEEPPGNSLFILTSPAPERLPTTIRSRCQKIFFEIGSERLRQEYASLFSSWKEDMGPLLDEGLRGRFSRASSLAEALGPQGERLPFLFECLQALWHDAAVWRETQAAERLLIPDAGTFSRKIAERKNLDAVFEEMDLILETEKAVEANVNKMLALERLFVKLMA